jgi:signal peptidase I
MENQTDNAIVQEAAVENTAPNAEIKKKRGRKPKNTIPQEAKALDAIEVVDKATDDEPSMDIEKERPEVHSAESSRDDGDEGAYGDNTEAMQGDEANETADTTGIEDKAEAVESDANSNDTLSIADNADEAVQEDTARAEHTIDVAEAMRRIMLFTEEMKAEAETEKVNETDAPKADDGEGNITSLSDDKLPEDDPTTTEVEENPNTETEDAEETDLTDNGAATDPAGNADEGVEPTEREALENDNASDEAKSDDTANKDVADAIAKETVNADDTTDIENTEDGEEYDDFGIEDEFGSIPDSFYEDDIPYSDDDNSSISALLYDDDDERITSDFEKRTSISFSEIKEQMKRLKDEATELHTVETEEVSQEESTTESEETADAEEVEEAVEEIPEITESPEEEMPTEEIPEEEPQISEKKSYIRDINKSETVEEDLTEGRGEHIITIDRARVKDKEIPEGRLIDTVFEAVELFTFAVLIIMLLLSFVFRHTTVSGPSMLPTFNDGDRLIISNLFYEPKRGDVVVFDDRTNEAYDDMPIIKRIIGLEGDVVKIEDGIIMVKENGEDEFKIVNYVEDMEIPYRDMEEVTVGKGEMFVMGDNVNNSLDSTDRNENDPTRNVGNIKTDSILGKVLLRFYVVETVFSEETQEWVTKGRIVFDTKFTLE